MFLPNQHHDFLMIFVSIAVTVTVTVTVSVAVRGSRSGHPL